MQKYLILIVWVCWAIVAVAQSAKTSTHQVAKGETLYSISKQYHITVEAIQQANKALGENFKLKIGQKLLIPAANGKTVVESKTDKKPAAAPAPKLTVKELPVADKPLANESSTHIVVKGETAYGIAKANGIKVKELKEANYLADDLKLKLGQKLIIPVSNPEAIYKHEAKPAEQPAPVTHITPAPKTVEQGREYSNAQAAIKAAEAIKQEPEAIQKPAEPATKKEEKAPDLKPDENPFEKPTQPVKTPPSQAPREMPTETVKTPTTTLIKNEYIDPNSYAKVFDQYATSEKKKVVYRGIAMFMQSDNPGNQFLALYNYADMGSVLKVTNLMSKDVIYVKVIGKVPAAETNKDVILKVSSEAAGKLKVTEDKFLVEVTGFNAE